MSERDGPESSLPVASPAASPSGGRIGPSDFEAEFTRHLRQRLHLAMGVLWFAAVAALVLNVVTRMAAQGWRWEYLADPELLVLLGGFAFATAGRVLLRRSGLSSGRLEAMDAFYLWLLVAVCATTYHLGFSRGGGYGVAFLGVLVTARAVVVPSRWKRTLLLSLPALPAILAVQILHALAGDPLPTPAAAGPAAPYSGVWWSGVLWDQLYLGLSVGIATMASRVTFRLQLSAYEAQRLGPYVLEARLGRGAMGDVYRARHALMRRPVALKFVRPEIVGEATLKRFEEEVRQTSRLTHPNTIAIYDYGLTPEGVFYYAMELLDGADLDRIVEATGPMPASRVIHVLVQACAALEEAHRKGLVHRDVKPSNLVLCERGLERDVLKVMDFGLVKDVASAAPNLTDVDDLVGSPHTIAPEVLRGQPAGPRSDLYALAAVGCFLLTGKPIFDAATVPEFLAAHLHHAPIAPSARVPAVPADLERVLMKSLAKEPGERHESAAALRADLLACADAGRWTQADAEAWWARQEWVTATARAEPHG